MYFSREFVSMEIFLWAMCSQDIFTRINKRTATHTHIERHSPFSLWPIARTQTHTQRADVTSLTEHHTVANEKKRTPSAEIHSFVFNEQKSFIAFSGSIFHLVIFEIGMFLFFFILRLSIHYYYYYQQQKRDSSLVWCLVTLAFEYLFKL